MQRKIDEDVMAQETFNLRKLDIIRADIFVAVLLCVFNAFAEVVFSHHHKTAMTAHLSGCLKLALSILDLTSKNKISLLVKNIVKPTLALCGGLIPT